MKITCPWGATIRDQTNNLPQKGHVIPDQEWFPVFDAIDALIENVANKRTDLDTAQTQFRNILGEAARFAYQCQNCGYLFVDDRQYQLHIFAPASSDTCKSILQSRPADPNL